MSLMYESFFQTKKKKITNGICLYQKEKSFLTKKYSDIFLQFDLHKWFYKYCTKPDSIQQVQKS